MTPDQFINIFQFHAVAKLFLLVLALFYFVFTSVVYRQVTLMTQVLDSKISPIVKTVCFVQILAAGFLFFLVVILA